MTWRRFTAVAGYIGTHGMAHALVARVRSCNDGLTRPPEEGEGAVRYLPQVLVRMRLGGVSNRSLRPR
jgi:hypothetical protein